MPDRTDDVARELAQREGVEVHETNGHQDRRHHRGRHRGRLGTDIASGFIGIEGVTGINLVYANFEDDPTLAEAGTR